MILMIYKNLKFIELAILLKRELLNPKIDTKISNIKFLNNKYVWKKIGFIE